MKHIASLFAVLLVTKTAIAQTNKFPATGATGIIGIKGILIPSITKTHTWMYASTQLKGDSSINVLNKNNTRPVLTNDIPITARRDFMKSFKHVQNAEWHKIRDGYFVRFNNEGVATEIRYNQDGRWLCSIRTCYEDQLNPSIKNLVKSKYKGYAIVIVQEYECYKGTVWIVSLDSKSEQILVRVEEGEMREMHHFYKSK